MFRAKDKMTGEIVAIKKVRMSNERDGFPITSVREINILKGIKYDGIIRLKETVVGFRMDSIFLVFEYARTDLANLVDFITNQPSSDSYFNLSEIKCIFLQICQSV